MEESPELLREISSFAREYHIEGEQLYLVFRKFYNTSKRGQEFEEMIERSFQQGLDLINKEKFIKLGLLISYLNDIEPNIARNFREIQRQYFLKSMINLNYADDMETIKSFTELTSKLIIETMFSEIMNEIQVQSNLIGVNSLGIIKKIGVLKHRLQWVTSCEQIQLNDKRIQVHNYINIILNAFQTMSQLNSSKIIAEKVQLLNSCLMYLVHQHHDGVKRQNELLNSDRSIAEKQKFINEILKCLKKIPMFEGCERQIMQLMTNMIRVYGIFDEKLLIDYIRKNYHNITKIHFLKFLKILISRYQQAKIIPKEVYYDIINNIYSSIFKIKKPNTHDTYQTIKLMSDIAIKINFIYPFDFTKEINKKLNYLTDAYHAKFLTSLLFIYDIKISTEVLDGVQEHLRKIFLQNRYYQMYENQMKALSFQKLNINILVSDPEKRDQCLLWDLLTIRNSIIINIQLLVENMFIEGIYSNMIRFIICNLYQQQCLQICQQIFSKQQDLNKYSIENIQFSQIFRDLYDEYVGFLPNQKSLICLKRVIKSHTKKFVLQQLEDLTLFSEVCLMLIQIAKQGLLIKQMRVNGMELLQLCIPENVTKIRQLSSLNIERCYNAITALLQIDLSTEFFKIYIQLLSRYEQNYHLKQIIISDNNGLARFQDNRDRMVGWAEHNKYEIICFIMTRKEFNENIYINAWNIIESQVNMYHSEGCLQLIELFRYFNEQVGNMSIKKEYYSEQVNRVIQVLQLIRSELKRGSFLQDIIALLQIQQSFHIYLFECLIVMENENMMGSSQITQEIISYISNQSKIFDDNKWSPCFNDQNKIELKKRWGCCYLSLLMLIPIANRLNRRSHYDNQTSLQVKVMAKFEVVKSCMQPCCQEEQDSLIEFDTILALECSKLMRNRIFNME